MTTRRAEGAGKDSRSPGTGHDDLKSRVAALESQVVQLKQTQEAQFIQVMKFAILRHLSVLGLLLDQSQVPQRISSQVRQRIDGAAKQIAEAEKLSQVREIDVALQRDLREIITAFKPS